MQKRFAYVAYLFLRNPWMNRQREDLLGGFFCFWKFMCSKIFAVVGHEMDWIYVIRFCADALLPQFFQKPVSFVLSAVFEPYSVEVPTVLSSFRFLGQLQFFCSFKDFG